MVNSNKEILLETFNKLVDIIKPFSIQFLGNCHIAYSEDYSTVCLEIDYEFYDFYLDIDVDKSIDFAIFPKIKFSSSTEKNKVLKFNSIEDAREDIIKYFSL